MKVRLKIILQKIIQKLLLISSVFIKIIDNRVLFSSYGGNAYNCNPKYISMALAQQGGYDIWWVYAKETDTGSYPKNVQLVCRNSLKFILVALSSKVVIENDAFANFLPKRKKQVFINTSHAGGAYKKIGYALDDVNKEVQNILKEGVSKTDIYLSASEVTSEKSLRLDHGYQGTILKIGMPRNDIFFGETEEVSRRVRQTLGIARDKKIVLYAPTFRPREKQSRNYLDKALLTEALTERFGGSWILLVRAHHRFNKIDSDYDAIDVSLYPDMQELLAAAEALITDYSSSIWDFGLTGKPCFALAPDIDEFERTRGFLTEPNQWPCLIAKSNEELSKVIKDFDETRYQKRLVDYYKNSGSYEKGTASAAAANYIAALCGQVSGK